MPINRLDVQKLKQLTAVQKETSKEAWAYLRLQQLNGGNKEVPSRLVLAKDADVEHTRRAIDLAFAREIFYRK